MTPDAFDKFGRSQVALVVIAVAGPEDGTGLSSGRMVCDGEGEVEDIVALGDGYGVFGATHCDLLFVGWYWMFV